MKINVSGSIKKKGTQLIEVKVNNQLRKIVREYYNEKKATNKLITRFINEGIQDYLKRKSL